MSLLLADIRLLTAGLTDNLKCCKLDKPDFSSQTIRVYEQHHPGYKCQNHSNGSL